MSEDWLSIVLAIGMLVVLVTSLLRPYLWLFTFGILLFISGALNFAEVNVSYAPALTPTEIVIYSIFLPPIYDR